MFDSYIVISEKSYNTGISEQWTKLSLPSEEHEHEVGIRRFLYDAQMKKTPVWKGGYK